jgi:branched-chain amino acid transport system substrate-binding protein
MKRTAKKPESKIGTSRRNFLKSCGGALIAGSTIGFPNIVLGKEPSEIPIGIRVPLSGPLARFGLTMRRGYELGIEKVNAGGGIKSLDGAKLKGIFANDEGNPSVGRAETERLINSGIRVLINNSPQRVCLVSTDVAERTNTPNLVATSASLLELEEQPRKYQWSFFMYQGAITDGRLFYETLLGLEKRSETKIRTAAFIYEGGLWGQATYAGIKRFHKKIMPDLEVVAEVPYPADTTSLSSELSMIKARKPDILCPTSYLADAILMTKTMYALRFDVMAIVGQTVGHLLPDYYSSLGKGLAEYTMGGSAVINLKNRDTQWMIEDAKRNFKQDSIDIGQGLAFDAIMVVKNALEIAKSVDKEKIREGLRKSKTPTTLAADDIGFDEIGANKNVGSGICQWLGSECKVIIPKKFADAEPVFPVPQWSERKV